MRPPARPARGLGHHQPPRDHRGIRRAGEPLGRQSGEGGGSPGPAENRWNRPAEPERNLAIGPLGRPSPQFSPCLSTGVGDFDADGRPDRASVGAPTEQACRGPGPWFLKVELASGRVLERRLPGCDGHCSFFQTTDFDRDGTNELLVVLGGGASTIVLGVFSVHEEALYRARLAPPDFQEPSFVPDHSPWLFSYAGSVGIRIRCSAGTTPRAASWFESRPTTTRRPRRSTGGPEHDLRFDGRDFHYLRSRRVPDSAHSEEGRQQLGRERGGSAS